MPLDSFHSGPIDYNIMIAGIKRNKISHGLYSKVSGNCKCVNERNTNTHITYGWTKIRTHTHDIVKLKEMTNLVFLFQLFHISFANVNNELFFIKDK